MKILTDKLYSRYLNLSFRINDNLKFESKKGLTFGREQMK